MPGTLALIGIGNGAHKHAIVIDLPSSRRGTPTPVDQSAILTTRDRRDDARRDTLPRVRSSPAVAWIRSRRLFMTSLDFAMPATRRPHLTARTANVAIADTKCEASLPRDSRARNHSQARATASLIDNLIMPRFR
jgi:hypothetical protein